jgi:hypothetical protein
LADMQTARGLLDSYITSTEARKNFEQPTPFERQKMARNVG